MEYRNITIGDYDQLSTLWKSIPGMGLRSLDDSRAGIEKYLRRNPTTSFAAVEDGKIIGCILGGHDGRRGFIYHTCVHPDHRGEGVGSRLVKLCCDALRAEGITKCALVCYSTNECGNDFWRSQGWELRKDLRQYRIIIVARLRSQFSATYHISLIAQVTCCAELVFCQVVQIERRRAGARQAKFVQDDGKDASKRAAKAAAGNCAVLP